ncbi:MAG: ABC transporter ATP-binding protein [Deltaproteobacteria bacterium]|nr:ABC transporter ATP-binding protein [Deltaproteobacteria bacterium]
MAPLLSLHSVAKRFGALQALSAVTLDVAAGEIQAVLGENGAGKSTLMKVIYGLQTPDAGAITWDGKRVRFASALDARRAGIGMVHQEFALVDALSVAENLALSLARPGEWRWRPAEVQLAARQLADDVGLQLGDLSAPVGGLPVGTRQRIEIVKALAGHTRLLILDEPTAVLTPDEVAQLFTVLDRLRRAGTAVLFITHKLGEVMAIADRITVMRRGRVVARVARHAVDEAELARLMVGPLAADNPPGEAPQDATVQLELDAVTVAHSYGPPRLDRLALQVRGGEMLGIAGVDGNGQFELFELLAGLRPPTSGIVRIGGAPVTVFEPAALLAAGVACIPPDRQREGVVGAMSVADNAVLNVRLLRRAGARLLHPSALRADAARMVAAYAIKPGDLDAPARSLSGGNLQKLIVARALALAPRVLVAVNPTRGLDLAAAQAVYAALDAALARGAAVLLISTELDEIVARAHRVAVLYRGRLSAPLTRPFPLARLGAMLAGSEAA